MDSFETADAELIVVAFGITARIATAGKDGKKQYRLVD